MKRSLITLLVGTTLVGGIVVIGGCGPEGPEAGSGAEPFTKLGDAEKLEKIKTMPISAQMKSDAIKKLNLPEADKQKAIAEVNAMPAGSGTPGMPPSSPGTR